MPEMAHRAPSASSSSSIGRSRVCPSRARASSTSSDRCTRPRSSLARMDPLPCTVRRAWDVRVSLSLWASFWNECSTREYWTSSRQCAYCDPSVRLWYKPRWVLHWLLNRWRKVDSFTFLTPIGSIPLLLSRCTGVLGLIRQLYKLSAFLNGIARSTELKSHRPCVRCILISNSTHNTHLRYTRIS